VPNPAKRKVLSAANLAASCRFSRLKDLIKVHTCSFPIRACGNRGRRRKGAAEVDVILGQVLVTSLGK